MKKIKGLDKRYGMTGIETAIILVAFVITASAFSFMILNVGFLASSKTQTVAISGMQEASSSLVADAGITGYFENASAGVQDYVSLKEIVFYVKLSQGHEPVDVSQGKLIITYINMRCHALIYRSNGTITTIKTVTGDGDALLEVGEKMQIAIKLDEVPLASTKPVMTRLFDVYAHPYERVRIELRPIVGSVLAIEKEIPAVYSSVMVLK